MKREYNLTFNHRNYAIHEVFKTRDSILKDGEAGKNLEVVKAAVEVKEPLISSRDFQTAHQENYRRLPRKQQKQEQWKEGI